MTFEHPEQTRRRMIAAQLAADQWNMDRWFILPGLSHPRVHRDRTENALASLGCIRALRLARAIRLGLADEFDRRMGAVTDERVQP